MNWADKAIANPQGYARAVLFPRARDALAAYRIVKGRMDPELRYQPIRMPVCICPEVAKYADEFLDVRPNCGTAPGAQLYGYRVEHDHDLDLDPLMTGWFHGHTNVTRIVSFGRDKILPLPGGGAALTSDLDLAEKLSEWSWFPGGEIYQRKVEMVFAHLEEAVYKRFDLHKIWDRYLGDMLGRIELRQVMPWNVMRICNPAQRPGLLKALRNAAIAVSTNYPVVDTAEYWPGGDLWAASVISFPLYAGGAADELANYERYVYRAAQAIYLELNPK